MSDERAAAGNPRRAAQVKLRVSRKCESVAGVCAEQMRLPFRRIEEPLRAFCSAIYDFNVYSEARKGKVELHHANPVFADWETSERLAVE